MVRFGCTVLRGECAVPPGLGICQPLCACLQQPWQHALVDLPCLHVVLGLGPMARLCKDLTTLHAMHRHGQFMQVVH